MFVAVPKENRTGWIEPSVRGDVEIVLGSGDWSCHLESKLSG